MDVCRSELYQTELTLTVEGQRLDCKIVFHNCSILKSWTVNKSGSTRRGQ